MWWYVASRSRYDTMDKHHEDEEDHRWLDDKR